MIVKEVDSINSKTAQFAFGQNYKKILSSSKASFDFRKFLQKTTAQRKMASKEQREEKSRTPLQEVCENTQSALLQNKAFKIRCYTKKSSKESQVQTRAASKLEKYKSKIYQEKIIHKAISGNSKENPDSENMTCEKVNFFQLPTMPLLQQLTYPIKAEYNPKKPSAQNAKHLLTLILDIDYLTGKVKASHSRHNEKDKQRVFFQRKLFFLIKGILAETMTEQMQNRIPFLQILLKVPSEKRCTSLLEELFNSNFDHYDAVLIDSSKAYESLSLPDYSKVKDLSEKIVIVGQKSSFSRFVPYFGEHKQIAYLSLGDKINFVSSLECLLCSTLHKMDANQIDKQSQKGNNCEQIPIHQVIERLKQRAVRKEYKRTLKSRRVRCQSSHEDLRSVNTPFSKGQRMLEGFKQKMLKYLKIVKLQKVESGQLRINQKGAYKTLDASINIVNSQEQRVQKVDARAETDFMPREASSKTDYQIVSELLRLNSHISKQTNQYKKQMEAKHFSEFERIHCNKSLLSSEQFDKLKGDLTDLNRGLGGCMVIART